MGRASDTHKPAETNSHSFQNNSKRVEGKQLVTLKWTRANSEGSRFSKGKHDNYTIIIRGIPADHPKDCIVELYATDKEMTSSEIKNSRYRGQIRPISRSIVPMNLQPMARINESVESMKRTAEIKENEMPKP